MAGAGRGVGRRSIVRGLVLLLLLPLAACTGGGPRGDGEQPALTPEQTAAALASPDPAQRRRGAWSVLVNLGVAVYTPTGEQVLAGVRPGADGVHVLQAQVDTLAEMAGTAREPMLDFLRRLSELGVRRAPAELLELYRTTYWQGRGSWLVRLLQARKVDFSGDGSAGPPVDALSEWLMLLDGFVDPAGSVRVPERAPMGTGQRSAPETAGWGLVYAAGGRDLALGDAPAMAYAHAMLRWQDVRIRMSPQGVRLAQGPGGPGDALDVVATVDVAQAAGFGPAPLLVADAAPGSVDLAWLPPAELGGHVELGAGGLAPQRAVTDAAGRVTVRLRAAVDPGAATDPARTVTGMLQAAPMDNLKLFQAVFAGAPAGLAGFLAPMPRPVGQLPVTVTWHGKEDCATFTDGEWTGTATVSGGVRVSGATLRPDGGEITFRLVVSGGNVVAGEVGQLTELSGAAGGGQVTGTLDSTSRPVGAAGAVAFASAASTLEWSVGEQPAKTAQVSVEGRFAPREGDCSTLIGDLALTARGKNAADGISGTLTARFTATSAG
ncbi:hypothetical protein GCM10009661_53870 [Catellatospora chokoriensis]|uniref:Uncharacterized protein n=1 Tax=Catellatospora chokoriensis TaxID=310353 RepID=A0A8J3NTD9_9ACTN|nr:hypothetical protein Cch02nite_50450 [Catellatospora chokoriensis]